MSLLIQYTLLFSSVLLLVALGGCFSEHSGVINLGLEGIMVIGALGGALTMRYLPEDTSSFVTFIAVAGASLLAGMLFSVLLAVPAIHLRADQTIIGTAMNMLATAFATVLVKAINTAANSGDVSSEIFYGPARSKMLINIGSFEFNWFVVLSVVILVAAWLVLYKTRFGLRLMACGEYPQAAASVGISVYKMRWAGVLISGALGGLGGIAYITCSVSRWKFENGVSGFGFLALALCLGLTGADAPGHEISRLSEAGNNGLPLTFAGFTMDQAIGWVNVFVCGRLCRSGATVDPCTNFLGYFHHTVSPSRTL